LLSLASACRAAQPYPPTFEGARAEVYKTVGDTKLSLYIFEPTTGPKENRPAIVFFFGGGWTSGSPTQFEPHCRYLATRGIVAITADYRVASRQQVKAAACVADAKSAVRWLRANAARLGLDPRRIAAGGGSAGGHIAAATIVPGLDEAGEDTTISGVPDALVLFNPALVLAPMTGLDLKGFGTNLGAERLGAEPAALSPAHHVKHGAPPTIIFHGQADTTVPYATAEAFARVMKAAGNRCELVGFEGQTHGFFNYGRGDNSAYFASLVATDRFLASLGWLKGEPTLVKPVPTAAETGKENPAPKRKKKAAN
jgi:acetyl esterase/lipase